MKITIVVLLIVLATIIAIGESNKMKKNKPSLKRMQNRKHFNKRSSENIEDIREIKYLYLSNNVYELSSDEKLDWVAKGSLIQNTANSTG